MSPSSSSIFRDPLLRVLIALDLAVGLPHLLTALLGRPFGRIDRFVDMDQEANLPTWIASSQWLVAAVLLAYVVSRLRARRATGVLPLSLLSATFALLSLDETARIHEKVESYLGDLTGVFVGSQMSLWLPVLGIVVFGGCALAVRASRPAFAEMPGSFTQLALGLGLFFVAATIIEPVLLVLLGKPGFLLVYVEETLELCGVSMMAAGAWRLAWGHGLWLLASPNAVTSPDAGSPTGGSPSSALHEVRLARVG